MSQTPGATPQTSGAVIAKPTAWGENGIASQRLAPISCASQATVQYRFPECGSAMCMWPARNVNQHPAGCYATAMSPHVLKESGSVMTYTEPMFSTSLTSALDSYVRETGPKINFGGSHTPDNKAQAPFKLATGSAYDVIKRITESELLVLELKVKEADKFKSPNDDQYHFCSLLQKHGVPIRYCYNLVTDYNETNNPTYTLQNANACFPNVLFEKENTIATAKHQTLQKVVDDMLAGNSGGGGIAAFLAATAIADVAQLNTRMLLLAYHRALNEVLIYQPQQFTDLAKQLASGFKLQNLDKQQMSDSTYVKNALASIAADIDKEISRLLTPAPTDTPATPDKEPEQTKGPKLRF
ncbi:hypothetical protein ACIOYV_07885 [Pseudomonas sp. NPDC087342]|uniref:hypothetical protein n=1 Tax=Pseudomonas sp. NPDC087342 TaxID=3364437 RepID=UPI0038251E6C